MRVRRRSLKNAASGKLNLALWYYGRRDDAGLTRPVGDVIVGLGENGPVAPSLVIGMTSPI
jgi:hypothetical protein